MGACDSRVTTTYMFQEMRAFQAPAALGDLGLELSHFKYISHLELFNPSPIHFFPETVRPGVAYFRQLFIGEFDGLCLQLAWKSKACNVKYLS